MAQNNFLKTAKGAYRKVLNRKVKQATEKAYRESLSYMEQQVLSHPLSVELISQSPSSSYFAKPNGSLFGLMGFKSTRSPISELLSFLKGSSGLRYVLSKGVSSNVFGKLIGPSDKDLAAGGILLDGWGDGRAWPEVVEKGIPGLSNYFVSEYGRSGKGVQSKNTLNNGSDVGGIKYLSSIFKNTKTHFTKTLIKELSS